MTQIGKGAFNNCSKLTTVYYKGTSRSDISIDSTGNEDLTNATWYYWTDAGASETKTGNWWYYDGDNIKTVVN